MFLRHLLRPLFQSLSSSGRSLIINQSVTTLPSILSGPVRKWKELVTTEVTALRREHWRSPYKDPCLHYKGRSGSSENLFLSPYQRHYQGYHFPHQLLMDFCGPACAGSMTRCVGYSSSIHILATQLLTLVDDHCHQLSEVLVNITPQASRVCAVPPLLPGTILTS